MIRISAMALSLAAVASTGCRTEPPLTGPELLQKLQKCRDELTKERPAGPLVSACAKVDPSPLNGISRRELAAALGPPTLCIGLSEGDAPRGADCSPQLDPKWSFHPVGRDGLELYCETDEKQRCEVVSWLLRSD